MFLIDFLVCTFGFVFNDLIDYKLDKTSKKISDRPLISGTIFLKKAWIFTSASMLGAFIIAFHIAFTTQNLFACPKNVTFGEVEDGNFFIKEKCKKKRYKSKWLYWSRSQ